MAAASGAAGAAGAADAAGAPEVEGALGIVGGAIACCDSEHGSVLHKSHIFWLKSSFHTSSVHPVAFTKHPVVPACCEMREMQSSLSLQRTTLGHWLHWMLYVDRSCGLSRATRCDLRRRGRNKLNGTVIL